MTEPLLTIDDATREFRVSAKTIRRRLTAGEIEGAYKRPGTRGPEWVMPRDALVAVGFVARDDVAPEALPEDEGSRTDYWARRALDAEAALRAASAAPAAEPPTRRRGPAVLGVCALILLALLAGLLLGRSTSDEDGSDEGVPEGSMAVATSLLEALTDEGDAIGHVGTPAADAVPAGREAVPVEEMSDVGGVRYVLVAGRAAARPVVGELETQARAVLRLPTDQVVLFDTADRPAGGDARQPGDERAGGAGSQDVPGPEGSNSRGEPGDVSEGTPEGSPTVADPGKPSTDAPSPEGGSPTARAPETGGDDEAPGGDQATPATAPAGEVVVAAGDSFWSIAEGISAARGGDVTATWAELVAANADRLVQPGNPDLLHVGQTLVVPALR